MLFPLGLGKRYSHLQCQQVLMDGHHSDIDDSWLNDSVTATC